MCTAPPRPLTKWHEPEVVSLEGQVVWSYGTTRITRTACAHTNRLVDHSYAFTKGDNGSWTRGSTTTLDFTVNRSPDDGMTFSHFTGIRIDGRDVPKEAYEAQVGSVVIKLKPAYLEKLKDGSHTIVANFNDGSAQARFTIEAAPASNVPDSANRKMPNTSDPLFGSAPLFLLAAGAVLCLAVAVRRRVK